MALAALTSLSVHARPAFASSASQDRPGQENWEGKPVKDILHSGFHLQRFSELLQRLELRKGRPYDRAKRARDLRTLFETGFFRDVRIEPIGHPDGTFSFRVVVEEYQTIQDVLFSGLTVIPMTTLKPLLQLTVGKQLDPYLLKRDREVIREELTNKGYYFSSVREEIVDVGTGVILHWQVAEGPLVTVRAIEFSGNEHIDGDTLKGRMKTQEAGSFLLIPTPGGAFVQRDIEEDIKHLKSYYYIKGWLDITTGERIFIRDLVFSLDRTEVTVKIHIDEGRRFRTRRISFTGNTVFSEEELRAALDSKTDDYFTPENAYKDAAKIREMYGERAYILAQVEPVPIYALDRPELELQFRITEREEIRIGRILVQGNTRTRFDVVLRELKDFAPGEKFNNRLLTRGINRLHERQYFNPEGPNRGISWRHQEGAEPNVRDVIIEVTEGRSGNVRFAGGYSSAFGILGIIEFQQRNFDLVDFPKSLDDLLAGDAFVGGGQVLNIRYAPSARRQSFVIGFREPYVFGYEFGMGLRGFSIRTTRESWVEEQLGGSLFVDKRLDPFRLELALSGTRREIDDVDFDAPTIVRELEGTSRIVSLTPAIIYDTREGWPVIYGGHLGSLSYEYAGDPLPGDFDFGKTTIRWDTFLSVFSDVSNPRLNHILNLGFTAGHVKARGDSTVPFFERFFAGGRNSIRGFEFRGMGPHEAGDPVGGGAYAFFSAEYSFPLLTEFLRGVAFYDVANLSSDVEGLKHDKWRNTVGFGLWFLIPQVHLPVRLDFGFPLTKRGEDERQTVTFDIAPLFN